MTRIKWQQIENTFDNATKRSFKLMEMISADHDEKLAERTSEPKILEIYNRFHPIRLAYATAYAAWFSARAAHKGLTAAFEVLREELSLVRSKAWDVAIQAFYPQGTPEYIALLPRKRKPFCSGSYEDRLAALEALVLNIGTDDNLHAVKVEVEAFTAQIKNVRTSQQGKEGRVKDLRTTLEQKRFDAATELFRDLGSLKELYASTPEAIEAFYEVGLLRHGTRVKDVEPKPLTVKVAAGTTVAVDLVFGDQSRFWFCNTGLVPLSLFTSGETPVEPPEPFVLAPAAEAEKQALELGAAGNRYLYAANHNPDVEGSLQVVLLTDE